MVSSPPGNLQPSKDIIMNRKYLSTLTLALAALAAGNALAADAATPKTREQVRAELLEAKRTGDIFAINESGLNLNELYPNSYPTRIASQGLSRAQVQADLVAAQRSGDIVATGESSLKLNELYPNSYPAKAVSQGLTRAQVQADLREAQRTGDIIATGESGAKLNQLFPSGYPKKS
jgi:hypothetical protein